MKAINLTTKNPNEYTLNIDFDSIECLEQVIVMLWAKTDNVNILIDATEQYYSAMHPRTDYSWVDWGMTWDKALEQMQGNSFQETLPESKPVSTLETTIDNILKEGL